MHRNKKPTFQEIDKRAGELGIISKTRDLTAEESEELDYLFELEDSGTYEVT
jgi:hypothetical protein